MSQLIIGLFLCSKINYFLFLVQQEIRPAQGRPQIDPSKMEVTCVIREESDGISLLIRSGQPRCHKNASTENSRGIEEFTKQRISFV